MSNFVCHAISHRIQGLDGEKKKKKTQLSRKWAWKNQNLLIISYFPLLSILTHILPLSAHRHTITELLFSSSTLGLLLPLQFDRPILTQYRNLLSGLISLKHFWDSGGKKYEMGGQIISVKNNNNVCVLKVASFNFLFLCIYIYSFFFYFGGKCSWQVTWDSSTN